MERQTAGKRPSWALLGITLAGVLLGVGSILAAMPRTAEAIAPCVQHTPSAEELGFLSALQSWRAGHVSGGSQAFGQSAALNAAAQGYAEFLANNAGAFGHGADGSSWVARATNCGYLFPAGGEGVALAGTASQALALMTADPGSGINVPSSPTYPIKCAGIGKATNGDKTAWVVLLFGTFGGECPQGAGGTIAASATTPASWTPTKPNTPTQTNTPTPTRTPTPSPTPRSDGAVLIVYEGWNLGTLPPGPVEQVLHRAAGCYRAIYQQNGDGWLRYSPEAPAYANNLHTLNGGTFWIEGTAANCGVVPL